MNSKRVRTVALLATVLMWSTVTTVLGQLAAVAALLPSLGLLIQQIVAALNGTNTQGPAATAASAPAAGPAGSEEPSR
ncbi:hypothetical protein [Streptomyces sp. NPDC006739]|uniref:hypothetical protein n=1 Tax=Streptomyces sp. NPDC006739 TaxID=3364763 RepID=UPI0036A006D0